MGLFDWITKLTGKNLDDLGNFLKVKQIKVDQFKPAYREFELKSKSGKIRTIQAPDAELKKIQRLINYRLLAGLKTHLCCCGFESEKSIVHNALPHLGKKVIIKIDIKDYFSSTKSSRVKYYFKKIGWNNEVAEFLTRLTTYRGSLPQGAPTSPRLSNLINYRLDARLAGIANKYDATYTRYADDITFSLMQDDDTAIRELLRLSRTALTDFSYRPNKKKTRVLRSHQQQKITGLVVNQKLQLPRKTRKWLRAIKHRQQTSGNCTLTPDQLKGWQSLEQMIQQQRN
ncbi:MAG: reverse transcriptase family protein [Candidatus Rifleibacteriota bacterium]